MITKKRISFREQLYLDRGRNLKRSYLFHIDHNIYPEYYHIRKMDHNILTFLHLSSIRLTIMIICNYNQFHMLYKHMIIKLFSPKSEYKTILRTQCIYYCFLHSYLFSCIDKSIKQL